MFLGLSSYLLTFNYGRQVCSRSLGLEVVDEDYAYEQQNNTRKWFLFSTFISNILQPASKSCTCCAKGNFPHAQYAFYLYAIDARRSVKCEIAVVMLCDITASHRRAAYSISHFTFNILHAAVAFYL